MTNSAKRVSETQISGDQSQPFGEFLRTIVRYLPAILPLVIVSAALAGLLTTPEPVSPTGRSQVGLTEEVVWPFFDTSRQRAILVVEDEAFVDELSERLGGMSPLSVAIEAPENQAFVYLTATAPDAPRASEAANAAAALLMERDMERLGRAAETELNRKEELLAASADRIAAIDVMLDEVAPEEAAARVSATENPDSVAARQNLLELELERTGLAQKRNEEIRLQAGLEIDVAEASSITTNITPELELLQRARPPSETPSRSFIPIISAAVVALLAGLACAVAWDRDRGSLRSTWQAEQVAGVRVLGELTRRKLRDPEATEHEVGLLMTELLDGADANGNIVAIGGIGDADIDFWLDTAVRWFERAGINAVAAGAPGPNQQSFGSRAAVDWRHMSKRQESGIEINGISTIQLPLGSSLMDNAAIQPVLWAAANEVRIVLLDGGIVGDRQFDQSMMMADAAVLITQRGASRIDQLRRVATQMDGRGTKLLGLFITESRLLRPGRTTAPTQDLVSARSRSQAPQPT